MSRGVFIWMDFQVLSSVTKNCQIYLEAFKDKPKANLCVISIPDSQQEDCCNYSELHISLLGLP